MSIVVDTSGFLEAWGRLQGDIATGYAEAMSEAVSVAKRNARETTLFKDRRGSGGTRSTIAGEASGGEGFVKMGGAAVFLEAGTKPHEIAAKNAPVLKFIGAGGRWVSKKTVWHKGTSPRPVIGNASAAGGQALRVGMDENTEAAISKFNK